MEEDYTPTPQSRIEAAICIDAGVYSRYRAVIRHLCVGLIDIIAGVRLLTSAAEARSLTLGPVQTILYKPLGWPWGHRRFQELANALADKPPSVVHAMSAKSFKVAQKVAAQFDADLVYEITALEDIDALHLGRAGRHRIICASQPLVEKCTEKFGRSRAQVSLIRPGVVCAGEATCFKDEKDTPTILATADLDNSSGVEVLLQALRLLQERKQEFLAFFLGHGGGETKLRAITKSLGLSASVVFAQPEGDVLKAMCGADIFVQPTIENSISARSLQALGQGMAVVSVSGGVHDAYVHGETAMLAKRPSATDIATAIENLLVDHELARKLGNGAIARMKSHHTMSAMAEATAAVYQSMVEQRVALPVGSQAD